MLSPHDRLTLFEALKPPQGYYLDAAAGTSFTLDLEAMLTAPIAFALYSLTQTESEAEEVEPVGLLEAVGRHADRITLFCQGGQIALPPTRRTIFAWLEEAVREVRPPKENGLFHPKVWVVRYRAMDVNETCLLRVLCATRNLTFDTSSDTLLRADSEPYREVDVEGLPIRQEQAELGHLFRMLPDFSLRPLTSERADSLVSLAWHVERVPLVAPEPFEHMHFHVFGTTGRKPSPFPSNTSQALIISPFLGESFLGSLLQNHRVAALISREESLDRIPKTLLQSVTRTAVLSSGIEVSDEAISHEDPDGSRPIASSPDVSFEEEQGASLVSSGLRTTTDEAVDPGMRVGGLHAKLYLFDTPDGCTLFTGSANATSAAFNRNVEVLAELHGPRTAGVNAILSEDKSEKPGFVDLLSDYSPLDEQPELDDGDLLEQELNALRLELAYVEFRVFVEEQEDSYTLDLRSEQRLPGFDLNSVDLSAWPVTLQESSSAQVLTPGVRAHARYTVTLEAISSFIGLRASVELNGLRRSTTFLVNAPMEGVPENRHGRLLAAMLRDRKRLLRYLLMLLHDDEVFGGEMHKGDGTGWLQSRLGTGWAELPLLELLLRALDRSPNRIDHIDRLLFDLGEERESLLPEGFESIWNPILQNRRGLSE